MHALTWGLLQRLWQIGCWWQCLERLHCKLPSSCATPGSAPRGRPGPARGSRAWLAAQSPSYRPGRRKKGELSVAPFLLFARAPPRCEVEHSECQQWLAAQPPAPSPWLALPWSHARPLSFLLYGEDCLLCWEGSRQPQTWTQRPGEVLAPVLLPWPTPCCSKPWGLQAKKKYS